MFNAVFHGLDPYLAEGMAKAEKACQTTAFGLKSIDREGIETATARMCHVILATAQGTLHPGIDNVESQGRMNTDGRMQAGRRLPGGPRGAPRAEAHAGRHAEAHRDAARRT